MKKNRMDPAVFFFNPNIHPAGEYEIRKNEVIRYARQMNVPFVDADYDAPRWFDRTQGFENEPEKGRRCDLCFDLRLSRAAEHAYQNGFPILTSSLGISRWKDFDQVTAAGVRAVKEVRSRHRGAVLKYWAYPWRKKGGSERMAEISKRENFYRQFYCGCLYSLQHAATRRKA
jgi:predicted adenine nucleotide alpha hydrolase (AANH) superfamily ATPase